MLLKPFRKHAPRLAPTARCGENATVIGQASLGDGASIWYGCVLRADVNTITVGDETNLQDNVIAHPYSDAPVTVGKRVTVGHGAILHGCTVEDDCMVGMGAILLNKCVIGEGSIVAAGALVTQGMVVPPGSLVMGSPAKVRRPTTPEERQGILDSALRYKKLAEEQLPLP